MKSYDDMEPEEHGCWPLMAGGATALFACLILSCASPAKVTNVVNTDPASGHTSQTTIVEYKDFLTQIEDTAAQYVVKSVKFLTTW